MQNIEENIEENPRSRTCRDVRMALASGKTTPTMERFAMKITETPITVSLQDH